MVMEHGKEEKKLASSVLSRVASKGVFPHEWAFTLLVPLRNLFLSPKKLLKRLDLNPSDRVLEVGSGPGYFSPAVAAHLSRGSLVLADIQQEMLDYAAKRMRAKGMANVEYYLCDGEVFDFPDASFDVIFLVTVLGEVENKDAYLREFSRLLKPRGLLSISELAGDPDKMQPREIEEIALPQGFEVQKLYGSPRNYTLNFRKKAGLDLSSRK